MGVAVGVIPKGAQGGRAPLVKITDHFWGLSPPSNFCIGFAFQSLLTLLPKCIAMVNFALLHDY